VAYRATAPGYASRSMRADIRFEPIVTERLLLRRSRPEDAETI
jgi:hypothetical protein